VHRRHALFLPDAEGVTRAWEGDEGQGPATSSVEARGGRLLFSRTFAPGLEDMADTWSLSEVRWDAVRKKVVEKPATAWGVILRTEDSLPAARAAQEKLEAGCEGASLLVIDTNDFSRLTRDKWVVVSLLPSRQEAESALKPLQACAPGAYVKRVR
jgi:hypothetical protein